MEPDIFKTIRLSSGFDCPQLGLGTYKSIDQSIIATSVKCAVQDGYRHIDTAYIYRNETGIGQALKDLFDQNVVKRSEMFITTKLFGTHSRRDMVPRLLKKQLGFLGLDYIDLYLVHSPLSLRHHDEPEFPKDDNGHLIFDLEASLEDTWMGMEDCVEEGLSRSIGVSNVNESQIKRIISAGSTKPAMLQIESHPYFHNDELISFSKQLGIAVTCFYPLGSLKVNLLNDECLIEIGKKYGKSAAQVCLRWQIQRGNVVIPKSESPSRIAENADIWNFNLSTDEMDAISKLDTKSRAFRADFPGAKRHPEFPFTELLDN